MVLSHEKGGGIHCASEVFGVTWSPLGDLVAKVVKIAISVVLIAYLVNMIEIDHRKIEQFGSGVDWRAIALSGLFVFVSLFFAYVRFRTTLSTFGVAVPERTLLAAYAAGQVGAYLPLNIIGQTATRAAILARDGVPTTGVAVATAIERLATLALLLIVAHPSAWVVLDLVQASGRGSVFNPGFAVAVAAAICLTVAAVATKRHRWLRNSRVVAAAIPPPAALKIGLLTGAVTAAMAGAYASALLAVTATPDASTLIAAILLVMFCASFPVSIGGWGVREVSAVLVLTSIGFDPDAALFMSVVVGLLTLAATVLMTPALLIGRGRNRLSADQVPIGGRHDIDEVGKAFVSILATVVAVLLFVQVPIPIGSSVVTVSAADLPVLLLSTGLLFHRSATFSMIAGNRSFVISLLLLSVIILLWGAISVASGNAGYWVLFNRMIGWIVIVAYAMCGMVVASIVSPSSLLNVISHSMNALVLVILTVGSANLAILFGVPTIDVVLGVSQSGFSANPNAFGFLVVLVIGTWLACRSGTGSHERVATDGLILGVTFVTLIVLNSRSSWILFGVLVIATFIVGRLSFSSICLLTGLMIIGFSGIVHDALNFVVSSCDDLGVSEYCPKFNIENYTRSLSRPSSDIERWESIRQGFDLWMGNPILGAGLGGFLSWREAQGLQPLVIHNVPVWLLAETGLAGFSIALVSLTLVVRRALSVLRGGRRVWAAQGVLFVLALFAIASQVHDFFFQRPFWFLLGLLMAALPPEPHARATDVRSSPASPRVRASGPPPRRGPPALSPARSSST